MKKILLLGPLENAQNSKITGGTIVLFSNLIYQCDKLNIDYEIIDTNKVNYPNRFFALLSIWFQLLLKINKYSHVSLHGSTNDYLFIAPVAAALSKLFGKKLSLRKFAGNLDTLYESMNPLSKAVISYTLKNSAANFFETKYLVDYFQKFNEKTYYFPNVREKATSFREGEFSKRFIYIGSITKEKGIIELLEGSNLLDESYTLHIYGHIADDLIDFDFTKYKAEYMGALESTEVLNILRRYDVLVLPSHREGYPGVIIEALSVGVPIIATSLQGIKEMVDDRCTVFIPPKSSEEIKNAILMFNQSNYSSYASNALRFFEHFDSEVQTKIFLNNIQ